MVWNERRDGSVRTAAKMGCTQEIRFTWARRELALSATELNNAQECSWAGSVTARPGELFQQPLVRFWHAPTGAAAGAFGGWVGSRRVQGPSPASALHAASLL